MVNDSVVVMQFPLEAGKDALWYFNHHKNEIMETLIETRLEFPRRIEHSAVQGTARFGCGVCYKQNEEFNLQPIGNFFFRLKVLGRGQKAERDLVDADRKIFYLFMHLKKKCGFHFENLNHHDGLMYSRQN